MFGLNKFYSFYMVAVVGILSRRGLSIDACCRNQLNNSKVLLYKLSLSLEQLHKIVLCKKQDKVL